MENVRKALFSVTAAAALFRAVACAGAPAGTVPAVARADAAAVFDAALARGLPPGGLVLVVDVSIQRASLVSRAGALVAWPVSTALAGTGSAAGSNRTPLGWHRVAERYGAGAAPGTRFVSRRSDGRVLPPEAWSQPSPAEDAVLTRVMWLEGLEPGFNCGPGIDSHERCIYIHGTNQEQLLGSPASHGCIRMSNAAVVRLFGLSEGEEMFVLVRAEPPPPAPGEGG